MGGKKLPAATPGASRRALRAAGTFATHVDERDESEAAARNPSAHVHSGLLHVTKDESAKGLAALC